MTTPQIHQIQPVRSYGTPLAEAEAAVILLHGRGATADSLLELVSNFPDEGIAYQMPQAANNTWYPNSGFAPLEENYPFLPSAMETIRQLLQEVQAAGIPYEKTVIGGFSQGACLASEFVAQHPQQYGGLLVFSGALMGPLDRERSYEGSLDGTPVFIGGVNQDPWVTEEQLRHTASVLRDLGAEVTIEVREGQEHTIRPFEIEHAKTILNHLP